MLFYSIVYLMLALTSSTCVAAQNALAPAAKNTTSSTTCAPIHIIAVRASFDQPGQGRIGTLALKVTSALPGVSNVEAIQYPASLDQYIASSFNGTLTTTQQIRSYVEQCPESQILLMGYSEGAHVCGDVLCGGGGAVGVGSATPPLETEYSERIVAMILMGDPRHVARTSFDVGSGTGSGTLPRPANISCEPFADKIRSYCDSGDPFCSQGTEFGVHTSYTERYNNDAFKFIISKLINVTADGDVDGVSVEQLKTASASASARSNEFSLGLLVVAVWGLFLLIA